MAKRHPGKSPRALDLSYSPRSYWSSSRARPPEAELARIALSRRGDDAIVLRARRYPSGRIRYRMAHEGEGGRKRRLIALKPASSTRPLTLGALIELLESACYAAPCPDEGDDERYGGVIWGTVRLHLEHGLEHADDLLFFLKVTSEHYPQLERYYAERLDEWCLANCVEAEDCGKVVRLRTGRFPRKLISRG
jgi:hypothetical protein